MDISKFLTYLMGAGPALAFWIAVIIPAAVMLRRGGGRAERFLMAGAGLKVIGSLLIIPMLFITPWLYGGDYSSTFARPVIEGYGIFRNIVGMAGIVCLVYAFRVKFNTRNSEGTFTLPRHWKGNS